MTTISLVTGASRGFGRNTTISTARNGGDVILTYRAGADEAQAVVALRRVGVSGDIGPMAASLLSPDDRWVTGQRV